MCVCIPIKSVNLDSVRESTGPFAREPRLGDESIGLCLLRDIVELGVYVHNALHYCET